MAAILFISPDGEQKQVDVLPGLTAMEEALHADVPGIDGECGGAGICGTCHVWVDESWADKLPAPEMMERDMLDSFDNACSTSRLSCQIHVTAALEGLVLRTPPRES